MLILNFNPFPILTTKRLTLRKVSSEDVSEIFFLRSDERVMKYIDKARAKSTAEAAEWILKILDAEKNNDVITWGISLTGEPALIGTVCYWNIAKEHDRAELGYALHPDFQEKGIMQETLDEVLKYGFEIMMLHSIEAHVNPANAASIRLLERNNFIREAYFKENYFYDGKFFDSAVYSLLSTAGEKTGSRPWIKNMDDERTHVS